MAGQDRAKELLFGYIGENEERLSRMMSRGRLGDAIGDMVSGCHGAVERLGGGWAAGILATGILHYVLTRAMIPSQRKVEFRGAEIDVVVPDLKTLGADPGRALVLFIPADRDRGAAAGRMELLRRAQPEARNIWAVLPGDMGLGCRTYVVSADGGSFRGIADDIARFAAEHGHGGFRILGI